MVPPELIAPGIATPPGYTLLSSVQFLNTLTAACDDGVAEIAIATQTVKARPLFIAPLYSTLRTLPRWLPGLSPAGKPVGSLPQVAKLGF